MPGSDTPFNRPITSYLAGGGKDGDRFWEYSATLVPSAVASFLGGIPTKIGSFIPEYAAYKLDAVLTGIGPLYSMNSKWATFANPVSGPGIYKEAVDMHFSSAPVPGCSMELLKKAINQPYLLNFPLSF
jgi:hypothetical protein